MIEPIGRGVLVSPHARGMTSWVAEAIRRLPIALRRDQHDRWKVSSIPPDVAREQRKVFSYGVGTDKEIRQHTGAGTAGGAVLQIGLAGEKESVARHRRYFEMSDAGQFEAFVRRFEDMVFAMHLLRRVR